MTGEKMANMREMTHEKVDKIMDKAETMRESGNEALAHVKEKATMMKKNIDGYIRKNPEKSVLIAAGAGAIVGAVLASAMMRRKD